MHFSVGVFSKTFEEVSEILEPFQENNMGTCPDRYLEFKDIEDECRKQYQEEHKKTYSTFEEFMEKYYGLVGKDEKMKRYGYWHNPNSKWDWYELGGRFRGQLLVKDTKPFILGNAGVFGDKLEEKITPKGYQWVDSAKLKDVEWGLMSKVYKKIASHNWDTIMKINEGERRIACFLNNIQKHDTKQTYIERASKFSTYAVITPSESWHEKESEEWSYNYYDRFIKKADPELYFTIIDCHI